MVLHSNDIMACPHVNVLPSEVGDLFIIMKLIRMLLPNYKNQCSKCYNRGSKGIDAVNKQVNHKNIDKFLCTCVFMWVG